MLLSALDSLSLEYSLSAVSGLSASSAAGRLGEV